MSDNGKTIISKVGVCIFGLSQKGKESTSETGMKDIGSMVLEMGMACFIMRMALDTTGIGRTT
jgi:hypothetical protein